jgi:outer membrane protein OmpA-like peptidoglycan-associated protein
MHTPANAASPEKRRFNQLSALPLLLGCLSLSSWAAAQQPQPPFGQPQSPGAQPPFGQPQPPFGQPQPPGAQPPGTQPQQPFGQPQPPLGQPPGAQPPGTQPQQPFGQPQPPLGQPQPPGAQQPFGQPQPLFSQPQPPFGQPPGASPSRTGPSSPSGFNPNEAPFDAETKSTTPGTDALGDESIEERSLSLMEQPSMFGPTGLLRSAYAGSGAQGTFRVSALFDWFSTNHFLCNPDKITLAGVPITCGKNNAADAAGHTGAFFTVNATPFSWLEGYATIRTYANSNDQGRPPLLQVLGDTTFGVKAFTPPRIGKVFTFGGDVALLLLNGTGGVGVTGSGTSALFRGLATADFRKPSGGFPLRVNVNLAYKLDNSANLIKDAEERRAASVPLPAEKDGSAARLPLTRVERFGLGINRVDFFQTFIGVELPFAKVQPFVEWSIDVAANRQGWACRTSRVSKGDVCLGLDKFDATDPQNQGGPGFKAMPSRVTLGVRTNPFDKAFHGLSATAALDIGTGATSTFIEEVAPQAPWMLYLGIGYAFDTREPPVPAAPAAPPAPPPMTKMVPAPQTFVRGLVHEQGKQDAVVDAIVSLEGGGQPPFATGPDGRFLTRHLEPGTYRFTIKAPGYKPGTCQGTVLVPGQLTLPDAGPQGAPGMQPSPFGVPPNPGQPIQPGAFGQPMQPGAFGQPMQPGAFGQPMQPGAFGQPQPSQPMQPGGFPGQPRQPGAGFPGQPGLPEAPSGPTYVDVDCALEALPRLGNIAGTVKDAEAGSAVAGAVVHMTDANGKEVSATADGSGNFTVKDLPPGAVTLKTDANGYMVHVDQAEIRPSEDSRVAITINKRPKVAQVRVQGNEIKISKQIHFETDSAKILGDSNSLLEEIADVLTRTPAIKKVEIQGHTDNTGTREHNQQLSDARANSVKTWLVNAGVDGGRLTAKGYGQDRPLAPNVTAGNRARNRRVQLIITEK